MIKSFSAAGLSNYSSKKAMQTVIKQLSIKNFSDWSLLWEDYHSGQLSDTATQILWAKIIDDKQPIKAFGLWYANNLVGFAHIIIHPTTWHNEPSCYLEDLYISDKLRGKGLAKILMQYLFHFAKDNNYNRVYWNTAKDNGAAKRLYDTLATPIDRLLYRFDIEKNQK